jgi:polysaccharide biosynthesis protein PslA
MVSQVDTQTVIRRPTKPLSPLLVCGAMRVFDALVICVAGLLTFALLVPDVPGALSRYIATTLVGTLGGALIFEQFKIYSTDTIFFRWLRVNRVLAAWCCTFAMLLTVAFALKITGMFSRTWAGTWFVSVAVLLPAGRLVLRGWLDQLMAEGRLAERVVIVGAGEHGQRLVQHLDLEARDTVRILGFIDDRATRIALSGPHKILGGTDRLLELIREDAVDRVFIALPWSAETRVRDLIYKLAVAPVHISLCPDLIGFNFTDRPFIHVAGLPMLQVFDRPMSGWSHLVKSVEDRVLAACMLFLLAPLLGLIAVALRLDSPGPVFFRQRRYGFNNKLIEVWKFRTMHAHMADHDATTQTTRRDPRVTRVGRLLRKTSLDELPQLINVLLGSMSIVGPRPHAVSTKADGRLFEEVVERYAARHRVKPGITGWAQVNGWRGETDTVEKIQKRVEYDLYYIDNWSVWLDLVILLRTAFALVSDSKNAY